MKKKFQGWRKKVAVGLLAAALCGSLSAQTAMATMHYDRRQTVAPGTVRIVSRYLQCICVSCKQKAWRKINGKCYNGSGKVIQGLSPEESMCPNGRKPSTGRK